MPNSKPVASLSLDLDNKWSYLKTHGDKQWESFPSYLDVVVPRILAFLKERNLKITFFVVGQDAALEKNHAAIKMLADAGHEIGNHSFNHEPWLHLYSLEKIDAELALAENHLQKVTGQKPVGFRGPGYSLSRSTLAVLVRRGYQYDCSTLPTYLGPLARAYYFMTAKLSAEEKQQRKKLFGSFREGLRPVKAYRWQIDDKELIEIPVTTMPVFKIPVHFSYILYLSTYSRSLAVLYWRTALFMCGITGVQPSLLLHPLDFLDSTDTASLDFFPAMKVPSSKKLALLSKVIEMLGNRYRIVPMRTHAEEVRKASWLPVVEPHFSPEEG